MHAIGYNYISRSSLYTHIFLLRTASGAYETYFKKCGKFLEFHETHLKVELMFFLVIWSLLCMNLPIKPVGKNFFLKNGL